MGKKDRMSCQHKLLRQMTWPDLGIAEICNECLLTRHDSGVYTTEWQDHNYNTIADWYKEAEELQREMDRI